MCERCAQGDVPFVNEYKYLGTWPTRPKAGTFSGGKAPPTRRSGHSRAMRNQPDFWQMAHLARMTAHRLARLPVGGVTATLHVTCECMALRFTGCAHCRLGALMDLHDEAAARLRH